MSSEPDGFQRRPRGGDHELDIVAILRRAQQPDGLAQLQQALDELRERDPTSHIAQLLEAVHETREQVTNVALAVAELAARDPAATHLVDTTKMVSYTIDYVAPPGRTWMPVDPPGPFSFFLAQAVSAEAVDPFDPTILRSATILQGLINHEPILAGRVPVERWRAPPGRGHAVEWVFSCMSLIHTLQLEVDVPPAFPCLLRLTLSGEPSDGRSSLPPPRRLPSFSRGWR